MLARRCCVPLFLGLCLLLGGGNALAQEQFELSVAGRPDLASQATLDRDTLVIVDVAGTRFDYERAQRLDSADGRYLGFFSAVAGQAVRWPISGTGTMLIGDAAGKAWRPGRQQIAAVRPAGPMPGRGPGVLGPAAAPGGAGVVGPGMLGSGSLAWLSHGPTATWTAHISPAGKLLFFDGHRDKWTHHQLEVPVPLVPGAPLTIVEDPAGATPRFLTVDPNGHLIDIAGGSTVRTLAATVQFPPGANLGTIRTDAGTWVLLCDARGKVWEIDVLRGRASMVEPHEGVYPAGAPIATLVDGPRASAYVVDKQGTLVEYVRAGGWSPATPVGSGFVPGSSVSAAAIPALGGNGVVVAAVDWTGKLAIWKKDVRGWSSDAVTSTRLSPGAPVAVGMAPEGPLASAIGTDGKWYVWNYTPAGMWVPTVISAGFVSGAPVLFDPASMTFFTTDIHGHLIASALAAGKWTSYFLVPGLAFTPQLVSRRVIPNPPLPPARVSLDNSGPDELIVQVVDQAVPMAPPEVRIPAGASSPVAFERDSGGTLEEVYLAPGPLGTLVEQVERFPIPPQPRYTIVAWSNKVTYQYIDRRKEKPKGAVPSFDLKSHVSLGVFPIPPGDLLPEGGRVDVYREATLQRNPGAVLHYPRPAAAPVQFQQAE